MRAARRCPPCAAAGDGYTFDGCYGLYTVTRARALLPFLARIGSGGPTAACIARAPPLPRPTKQPLSLQVLSSTEYLLPNKNGGDWDNKNDTFKVSQLVAGRQGLAFTWGPPKFCANTKCDYNDGTNINQTWCEAENGPLPPTIAANVYGGSDDPVCSRPVLP